MSDPHPIAGHVATFQARILTDAMNDATSDYWARRAATFEWARPRPGDYIGRATASDLAALDKRICDTRDACLARSHTSLREAA